MTVFSINPAFDMRPATENLESMFGGYDKDQLSGIDPDRARFYQMCEENNVGLTVMKGYFGGALLADNTTGKHIEKALFTAEEVEMLKALLPELPKYGFVSCFLGEVMHRLYLDGDHVLAGLAIQMSGFETLITGHLNKK